MQLALASAKADVYETTHTHTELLDASQAEDFQFLEGSSVVYNTRLLTSLIIKKALKAVIIC